MNLTEVYLHYPLKTLYLFGLWNPSNKSLIYSFFTKFLVFFTQYLYVLSQIIYMISVWGDIEKMAEASFLLLTQLTLCIKVLNFFWNLSGIKKSIALMEEHKFTPKNKTHIDIIKDSVKIQNFEYSFFSIMAVFTISSWGIIPLIDKLEEQKPLPFSAWYPMLSKIKISPYYEFLYSYQIIGISFSAMININVDKIFTGLTANAEAQVRILIDNLIQMEKYANDEILEIKAKMNSESKTTMKSMLYVYNSLENNVFKRRLVDCVHHHQTIIGFVRGIEENFHWGILAQFAASVGIICITGLQITLINPASLKFFSKLLYFMAMLAQLLFLCRIGNKITAVSCKINTAVYKSSWIDRNHMYKKDIIFLMERFKNPIVMRAGNFFPLSLQTYVTILRSSYSFFAVLQQMNST